MRWLALSIPGGGCHSPRLRGKDFPGGSPLAWVAVSEEILLAVEITTRVLLIPKGNRMSRATGGPLVGIVGVTAPQRWQW